MIESFVDWLSNTGLSLTIQKTPWIVAGTQSVHYLSLALVFTSVAMLDLRLAGIAGARQSVASMSQRLLPIAWWALLVVAVTGTVLVIGEPGRAVANQMFQMKMLMLAAVLALTLFVQSSIRKRPQRWEMASGSVRAIGLISLLLWILIVAAGRWIAYW